MRALLLALLVAAPLAATAQPAASAVLIVTTADDELNVDGDCSLREAIASAETDTGVDLCLPGSGADIISFLPTLSGQPIPAAGLVVSTDITIDGTATPDLSLDGRRQGRILMVQAGGSLTLRGLTLRRGLATSGGAVMAAAGTMLTVDMTTFQSNEATGATAAVDGGGAIWLGAGATATITGSLFRANMASGAAGSGGALFNAGGSVTATGTRFSGNTANRAGGAVEAVAGSTTLVDVTLADNDTGSNPGNGGGLHITGAGMATLTGGDVNRNTAVEGGGLWCAATCTMTVTGTMVRNNTATGGALATKGGGGLFNLGTMTLSGATVTGNAATSTFGGALGSGGGILNVGGTLTVTGGTAIRGNQAARAGGGIESNAGSVTLSATAFVGNTTGPSPGNGGALHVTGAGTVTATDVFVRDNTATREGGGFWNDSGTMTLTGSRFIGNTAAGPAADDGGGGLFNNGGTMILSDVTVRDNLATGAAGSGGGVFTLGGTLTMTGGLVRANRANRAGAGIEVAGGGSATLTDVLVASNVIATPAPGNGGGLHAGGGSVTILGGRFMGNVAAEGGGLWASGTLTMMPSATGPVLVRDNEATGATVSQGGGGVYVETGGTAMLTDVRIANNRATGAAGSGGGLMLADGATATVSGGMIERNTANRAGAGIEVFDDATTPGVASVTVERATIASNAIATPAPGNGGGLHTTAAATATLRETTVSGNTAREGAGLWIAGGGALTLTLSTVSGNTATEAGGGVYDNGGATPATITITDATITLNRAGTLGGGVRSQSTDGTSYALRNTVVGGNTAPSGADCAGMVRSEGTNLVQSTDGCTISGPMTGDVTGMDPMLLALADNGGPTMTHLPGPGSPVLDAGQSVSATDQRGFVRTDGLADIGAVERSATGPAPLVAGGEAAKDGDATATFALLAPTPNPTAGDATLRFTLADAQPAVLTLHDLLGRTVATLYDGDAPAGAVQSVRIPTSGLAPGVYVVRLVSAGQTAVQRLTVLR